MTSKQAKYLKARAAGRTKKRAALEAGYSLTVANTAKQNIESCLGAEAIEKVMARAGIGGETIARVYAEALNATRIENAGRAKKIMVPDHAVRLKAADTLCRLAGLYDRPPLTGTISNPITELVRRYQGDGE